MYTAFTHFSLLLSFCLPKKHFQERQKTGAIYQNGLKERYNNLEIFYFLCLNIKTKTIAKVL